MKRPPNHPFGQLINFAVYLAASSTLVLLLSILFSFLFPLPAVPGYSTLVLDGRGTMMHAFLTPDQQWRMHAAAEEISPLLRKTVVAKEDRYFFRHAGINPISMVRAVFRNLLHGKRMSGASTITMQVARALEPKRRTYVGKLMEVFRAVQLETHYSKLEILNLYLNLAPYGGNIQGVKAAALMYFNKNPDHLSLAEITALSIIPNRPSSLVVGKNNDAIVTARNHWLRRFEQDGVFTHREIEDALEEPLTARRRSMPAYLPHLSVKLRSAGGTVHTYIDINMQSKIEKLTTDYVRSLRLQRINNAAVIVMDNTTGRVLSYLGSGGFGDTTDHGQVNGAAAIREPGSTLKPFLYAMAIDRGLLTPKTVMEDVPVNYAGYAPENYDRKFNGYVSMEYALEHSLNIPAVRTLNAIGKDEFVELLAAANFHQVRRDRGKLGLSMVLGGCGATLEELTGIYSSFSRGGKYIAPVFYEGQRVSKPVTLFSSGAAFMIGETLSKLNRPDFPLNWQATERMPKIAWKTGTSYGRRDGWSIGFNKRYTVGVWTGNFSGEGIHELSGAAIATPLLFRIFNTIDYDADESWFAPPADCLERIVCSETGLVPGERCTNRVTDYYVPLVSSTAVCENSKEIFVSADGSLSYCQSCVPATGYRKQLYPVISADMCAWMDANQIVYEKLPPHNPACPRIFREGAPQIISLRNGNEYLINRKHPEALQLACKTGNETSRVFWYVNDRFYKAANANERLYLSPEEGPLKVTCSDEMGRVRNVLVTVRLINY